MSPVHVIEYQRIQRDDLQLQSQYVYIGLGTKGRKFDGDRVRNIETR